MFQEDKGMYSQSAKNALAASLACTLEHLLHPFDVIEARFQSHDGKIKNNLVPKYRGVGHAATQILATEGVRGLYKGVGVSLLSSNVSKMTFFGCYAHFKAKYEKLYGTHGNLATITASVQSSLVSSVLTSPLFVVKTRVVLATVGSSVKDVVSGIYVNHGLNGFYKGLGVSAFLSTQTALQLSLYEFLNKILTRNGTTHGITQMAGHGYSAVVSKFCVSVLMYPLNVVRTRLQQANASPTGKVKYQSAFDCLKKTYRNEGFRGFYKGFMPNTMKGLPSNALFFCCYEIIRKALP